MRPQSAIHSRVFAWLGSLVLVATAAFHGSGFSGVAAAVDAGGLNPFVASAVKGLWLFASIHWLALALLAAIAAAFASPLGRLVLAFAAALLVADVILLLVWVGPFVGELMLGIAALSYALSAAAVRHAS